MTTAFVLGNGVSRQAVDFELLRSLGRIYGCNALYRDHVPDVLVATDRAIAMEIQNSGYSAHNIFYTRKPMDNAGALKVPVQYYGYSSGPVATGLAAIDQHRTVYMIGFDMGPVNNRFNNVYADTDFYRKSDATPVYTGNWIRQIRQICADFANTRFVRVQGTTTAVIGEFAAIKNLEHLPINTFLHRINNQKDL